MTEHLFNCRPGTWVKLQHPREQIRASLISVCSLINAVQIELLLLKRDLLQHNSFFLLSTLPSRIAFIGSFVLFLRFFLRSWSSCSSLLRLNFVSHVMLATVSFCLRIGQSDGQHYVEKDSERPYVWRGTVRLQSYYLGGHITACASSPVLAHASGSLAKLFSQTEVHQLSDGCLVLMQHNILEFDVAMDDRMGVQVLERICDL